VPRDVSGALVASLRCFRFWPLRPPMTTIDVTRTYLELIAKPGALPEPPEPSVRFERVDHSPPSFYRYLYSEVGRAHRWIDRLDWDDERIAAHLADPDVALWLLSTAGAPTGFVELRHHADGSVEIAYLGLLPELIGRGLGRYLLRRAIAEAASAGPVRVWLHTCTLDHPAAMPNYVNAGFVPMRQEVFAAPVPTDASGVYLLVRQAIERRQQVVAYYRGHRREMCPHVLGTKRGRAQALFYQFGGSSGSDTIVRGAVENWRCIPLDELTGVEVREGQWFSAETGGHRQRCVDEVDIEVPP
jgi:GNAT superfamily N-acetyltransferase